MGKRICSVPECNGDHYCRGYCRRHYRRLHAYGDPLGSKPHRQRGTCTVDGCNKPHQGLGYCQMHYTRLRKNGDVGPAVPIGPNRHERGPIHPCAHPECPLLASQGPLCSFHRAGWIEKLVVPDIGPCWQYSGTINDSGYGTLHLPGDRNQTAAHRAAYRVAYGPIPDGLIVRHRCDNPPCVNPRHLLLGTHQDNSTDAVERDRVVYGERSHMHILTEAEVVEARKRYATGRYRHEQLAEEYHVTRRTMARALSGETWRRADGPHADHRTRPKGEAHVKSRLTEAGVRDIRARHAAGGVILRVLAEEYGVSRGAVQAIIERRSWKHVK